MFKKLPLNLLIFAALLFSKETIVAQETDTKIYDIISKISADSIEADIRKLVSFGTRNTFSDTVSDKRGIGAARRWIKSEFDNIASQCGCMDVFYQKD
ncbi:MAG: peptidase M28, partial [Flavobacteriaceae bacterium]|nr:peptidase M28 [Flavobacteriaceae bacterium]